MEHTTGCKEFVLSIGIYNRLKCQKLLLKPNLLPVMEAFHTLQGEGFHAGKAAYFIRIVGGAM